MSVLPVGIGASGDEYTLDNSLRFRSSASAYLTRTPSSTGDRTEWTWSGWVKRSGLASNTSLFSVDVSGYTNRYLSMLINSSDEFQIFEYTGAAYTLRLATNAVFRDPSAWYHLVCAVDTDQATSSDRVKLYVNGVQQTSLRLSDYPSSGLATYANVSGNLHAVGATVGATTTPDRYMEGYLTEINFIDGQALDPTDFGEFDATTGVWKPKAYSGTYGTNGFYLPTTATTQADGFNTVLYTGTGAVQTIDDMGFAPDLVWIKNRTEGYNHVLCDTVRGVGTYLASSTSDADAIAGSVVTAFNPDGYEIGAIFGANKSGNNIVAWGWDAGANQTSTGISSVAYTGAGEARKVTGFGFSPDLVWIKRRDNASSNHELYDSVRGPLTYLLSDTTIAEGTNTGGVTSFDSDGFSTGNSTGSNINIAGSETIAWGWDAGDGDPVTNTQGSQNSTVKANDATGFSIITYTGTGANATYGHGLSTAPELLIIKSRSGSGTSYQWMVGSDPQGWSNDMVLNSSGANGSSSRFQSTAPTSTVFSVSGDSNVNGSGQTYVAYAFDSVAGVSKIDSYSGTGSAGNAITGLGFKPGFLMIKRLDATAEWVMVDSTRDPFNSANHILAADDSLAESSYGTTNRNIDFDSDGFTIQSTAAGGTTALNDSGGTYLYMAFKGSYSDYVSPLNDTGTIDSRVKANPDKGFSIVSWEGSGSNGTIGHGLSSAPEFFFLKNRDTGVNDWIVYQSDVGATKFLRLNQTNATTTQSNIFNDTAPTSSVLSVGTNSAVNSSGVNYIAYCFHSVAGYSDTGTYTGTGSAGKAVTGLGFQPAWLMIKETSSTGSWAMIDTTRSPDLDAQGQYLWANLSDATGGASAPLTFDSDGFTINSGDSDTNASGQTYIYMAFADTRDAQFNFDASGNKNNWTPNNINSNASSESSYDIMTDVPTLTDEYTANYCTLNPLTLNAGGGAGSSSDGNLKWIGTGGNDNLFGTMAASSGNWYYEIEIVATPTTLVAGWSTTDELADYTQSALVYYNSAGIRNGNRTVVWNTNVTTGLTFSVSDVIGFALDIDSGDLKVYQNNSLVSTITLPADKGDKWIPAFGDSSTTDASFTVNFGQRPFAYTPPTGFLPLNTYNLPDSDIIVGAEHMKTVEWTGTTAAQSIDFGMQPDLIWAKGVSSAAGHRISDSVRGGNGTHLYNVSSADNANENTDTVIDAITSTGIDLGTLNHPNNNGTVYVGWGWKANGSGVSNTVGSINSTVSANTTSGFSIVQYTGNGLTSSGQTVGHGLGRTPEMIITKLRSGTQYNWSTWHKDLSTNYGIWLNLTNGQNSSMWNGSSNISSTVFAPADLAYNNVSGATYINYVFAPVEGFSAFGKYTGNGSTDGPFVYTGFRPAWIMVKRTSTTGNWQMFDSTRDLYNPEDGRLYANLTNAESDQASVDFLSNGFKMRDTSGDNNSSGQTYIYAAFAENPFKNSLAR